MKLVKLGAKALETERLCIRLDDSLKTTLDLFRRHTDMRLLAVVDADDRPIGGIREIDVRALLFNRFGYALMCNPSFGQDVAKFVRDCPVVEADAGEEGLAEIYRQFSDSPGVILTRHGRFERTVSSDGLVGLLAQARVAHAERVTQNCELFTQEIVSMAGQLSDAAKRMRGLSHSLSNQAVGVVDAAQNVACSAAQSSAGLQDVNERGHILAKALEQLADVAQEARNARARTTEILVASDPKMAQLTENSAEIGKIVDMIRDIGRATNFLALNAQIEATRSNDSNNGFIAVAGEIKQLAVQTRASADDVTGNVERINTVVADVVTGHKNIVGAMESINAVSGQIEQAVKEQSTTSLTIAGFVEQAAQASQEISSRATQIDQLASRVQSDANELGSFAELLSSSADLICSHSQKFVRSIQFA
jgi:methyl-accepting chemotaxis protein